MSQRDEARDSMLTRLALDPGFTLRRCRAGVPTDHPACVAKFEQSLEALREAGVPEG